MSNPVEAVGDSPRNESKGADIIRSGHLKKQGGARGGRKNWKKRWFVLKSDYICYFQEKDGKSTDGPCLGVLPLRSAKVISVEVVPDDGTTSSQHAMGGSAHLSASAVVTTCYLCHKPFSKKVVCKSCQNVFCENCASELQMGDKTHRVCSRCRCQNTDEDIVKDKGSPLELGIIVEVQQREPKNSNSMFFKKERPQYLFAIKTKERELWLAAEDAQEKAAWIHAIADVIVSFRKSLAGTSESGVAGKDEADVPSGTLQWEIDYEAITILEKIGDGAFGEVFKGRLWGTDVAVKTIKPDQATEGVLEDLKKEVAILSQLRHPNIVLYIGACTKPPNVCIVTEWCDRGSLHDVLHDSNIPLDIQRIVSLAVGIAQGMNYLHSLERRIIHRDLKSHNIIVDRNFNVKVADFGLSHVRETLTQRGNDPNATQIMPRAITDFDLTEEDKSVKITSESIGGHYGVFGTPEWMAPEIMEGTAYNQKVDVYSFGIMMSELLTRKLPFRDQYKIKSYLDVVDAVLDDGAMPTLPPWIGARLKRLIELCLSRNSHSRPSFTSIILKLRSIFSASPADLFIAFDIPRITHMLSSTDRHNQALAAKEISLFKFDHEFLDDDERRVCARCKYSAAQHRPLDDGTVTVFTSKLTDMLASSSAKVVLPAVEALEKLVMIGRHRSDTTLRTENLRTICEKNGVERLIGLVASKSERLSRLAARALMLIVDDLPVDDMSYRSLKPTSLNVLSSLMIKEMVNLRESSHKFSEALQEKKETVSALKSSLAAATASKPISANSELSRQSLINISEVSISRGTSQSATDSKSLDAEFRPANSPIEEAQANVEIRPIPPAEVALHPALSHKDADAIEEMAHNDQDETLVVNQPNGDADTREAVGSHGNLQATIVWPPTPTVPLPPNFPASFLDPKLVLADWVLVHDAVAGIWKSKYVVVQPSLILIYPSHEAILSSPPPAPESFVNASVPAGKKLKFKTGRRYKQPYCFHLCCQGLKWWFALRSEKDTLLWSTILVSDLTESVDATIQRYMELPSRNVFNPQEKYLLSGRKPSSSDSQDHQTAISLEARTESDIPLLAVDVAKSQHSMGHDLTEIGTPCNRMMKTDDRTDNFLSSIICVDKKSDKDSGVEENDKSQNESPLDLADTRVSLAAINLSAEFGTDDEHPTSDYNTADDRTIEDQSWECPDTDQLCELPEDEFRPDTIRDKILSTQVSSECSEASVPMTPLVLFTDEVDAPSTIRHRDRASQDGGRFFDAVPDNEDSIQDDANSTRTNSVHQPLADGHSLAERSIDNSASHDENDPNLAASDAHPSSEIDSSLAMEVSREAVCLDRITTAAAVDDRNAEPSAPRFQTDSSREISNSAYHTTTEVDESSEDNDDGNHNLSMLDAESNASDMDATDALQNMANSSGVTRNHGNDLRETSPNDAFHIERAPRKSTELGAPLNVVDPNTSASETELSSDIDPSLSSPTVNRFVRRYIDVAAPSTSESDVNVCLTIKSGDEMSRSGKHLKLKPMPSISSLPSIFSTEFGRRNCWQYAYLITANTETMKWEHRFMILLGSHPRRLLAFKNHESLDLSEEYLLEGGARIADGTAVTECLGFPANVDPRTAFVVGVRSLKDDVHRNLLCICATELEKNRWMSLIERIVLISRTVT